MEQHDSTIIIYEWVWPYEYLKTHPSFAKCAWQGYYGNYQSVYVGSKCECDMLYVGYLQQLIVYLLCKMVVLAKNVQKFVAKLCSNVGQRPLVITA